MELPVGVIELNAGGVLLVLRQAKHLQVVVTHKVLCLGGLTVKPTLGLEEMWRKKCTSAWAGRGAGQDKAPPSRYARAPSHSPSLNLSPILPGLYYLRHSTGHA